VLHALSAQLCAFRAECKVAHMQETAGVLGGTGTLLEDAINEVIEHIIITRDILSRAQSISSRPSSQMQEDSICSLYNESTVLDESLFFSI